MTSAAAEHDMSSHAKHKAGVYQPKTAARTQHNTTCTRHLSPLVSSARVQLEVGRSGALNLMREGDEDIVQNTLVAVHAKVEHNITSLA